MLDADLNKSARKLGLTVTELNFLWTIYYEKELTVSRMAELTLLDSSTVTQVINRLKNKKLVCSRKKLEDTRFSYLRLTDMGNEKRKLSMRSNNESAFFEFLVKEMKIPDEKEKIVITLDFLKKINQHFHGEEFINWVYSLPEKLEKEINENSKTPEN